VFLQVINPELFAGRKAFTEQIDDLSEWAAKLKVAMPVSV
jgi:hypothetical protein